MIYTPQSNAIECADKSILHLRCQWVGLRAADTKSTDHPECVTECVAFMRPTAEPLLSEYVCLLKRLSNAHACEHRRGILIHTSKSKENKLPHLEPRTQRVKDSRPPGLKDSRIQTLNDSRIQAFKDSRTHGWKDSTIHVLAFVPRTTASDIPEFGFRNPPERSIRRHLFQSTGGQT